MQATSYGLSLLIDCIVVYKNECYLAYQCKQLVLKYVLHVTVTVNR